MNKLRAALKALERIVFLPPDPRRGLRLIECRNEIRVHGTPRDTRKHLAVVRTEKAPLRSWTTEYRYDSVDKCKAAVKNLKMLVPMGPEEVPYAKCVASDDQRLAK
jgi:hypothetical protein